MTLEDEIGVKEFQDRSKEAVELVLMSFINYNDEYEMLTSLEFNCIPCVDNSTDPPSEYKMYRFRVEYLKKFDKIKNNDDDGGPVYAF
jgi:hypothetical protein